MAWVLVLLAVVTLAACGDVSAGLVLARAADHLAEAARRAGEATG